MTTPGETSTALKEALASMPSAATFKERIDTLWQSAVAEGVAEIASLLVNVDDAALANGFPLSLHVTKGRILANINNSTYVDEINEALVSVHWKIVATTSDKHLLLTPI
jgi:hypothetical protein